MKQKNDPKQMWLDFRVKLEPTLEALTLGKSLDELEELFEMYLRFARQLQTKIGVIRLDLGLRPISPRERRAVYLPRSCRRPYRN